MIDKNPEQHITHHPEATPEKVAKYEEELARAALNKNPNMFSEAQIVADKIRRQRQQRLSKD